MRNFFTRLALLAIFLSAPFALHAQNNASMTGEVTDATGAVVPGTVVNLTNHDTGVSFTATTNTQGTYRFPNVPPNKEYKASFSHDGFSQVIYDHLTLSVGITRTQDVKLLAGASTSVEVSGAKNDVTLNTTDGTIGNNFDVKLLEDLPVINRNSPTILFTLQPGYAGGSFTGARTDQNSVTVDGMDVNDIAAGGFGIVGNAPVDSIQEFRGTVGGLGSNLGTGSGGQFQLVTKNGTNAFHGNLNEYHRDTATAANAWFLNNSKVARTPLIRNQFGGNVGGPILKDKLFFFFDFNNSRIVQSSSTSRTVPLDSYRNGNLSYILATAGGSACPATTRANNPATAACVGTLTSAQVAALDPNHVGFSPTLLAFINSRYPHANDLTLGDGINTGGYRFTQPTPDTLYNYIARFDYNLTSKQRVFVRFSLDREQSVQSLNAFPTDPLTNPFQDRSYGYVISHIWQIGQNKVNQFYYGTNITKYNFANTYFPTAPINYTLGALSAPYNSGSSQKRRIPIPEIRDDFNWVKGNHNIGFGGTFKFIKTNSNLVNDFTFVGVGLGGLTTTLNTSLRPADIRTGTTATGLFDSSFTAALGRINSISSNYNYDNNGSALPQAGGATRSYRYFQTELYLGDNWKITKDLTISYGLRYQLYTVPYETHGIQSNQNLTFDQLFGARTKAGIAGISGDTVVPFVTYNLGGKANNAGPLYNPSYKDFAPRFSFAYNPSYSPKTVINGSASMVYDRTVINAINFLQDQNSFLFQNNAARNYGQTNANLALAADPRIGGSSTALALPASVTFPTAPAIGKPYTPYVSGTTPNGGITGAGYSYIVDPTLKDPYSINFTFGVQQEMPGHFILKANWDTRLGRRLLGQADASQVTDFTDTASGQGFVQAFANVTQQRRAGQTATAQPWFTHLSPFCTTACLVANFDQLFQLGDIADFANALLENGLIANNTVVGAQFALNPWITNKGFSSYNGLLVTLTKNLSHGVQFDANYTWSHSIDNASAPANYQAASSLINFICDANAMRTCRGNSDFDVQNVFNSNFIAELPFGHGRQFLSHSNRFVNEIVGGWSVSGTPSWRSGLAFGTTSDAFAASFNENAPAIFNGNRGAVASHIHKIQSTGTVQIFTDQTAAAAAFTGPIGLTLGSRNNLRGPSAFTFDSGLAKIFPILADNRLNLKFRADFFNVLNHPVFNTPGTDFTSSSFGQVTGTPAVGATGGARVGQFALRLEF